MAVASTHSYDWIRHIDEAVASLDQKPQFGEVAPFPWARLEDSFRKVFAKPDLTLFHQTKGWVSGEKLWEGMGRDLLSQTIYLAPLETPLYFAISDQDLRGLMSLLLGGEEVAAFFIEKDYIQGFYQYLALEALNQVVLSRFTEELAPRIGETPDEIKQLLSSQTCFIMDVALQIEMQTFWARIFIPNAFRDAWKRHFAERPRPSLVKERAPKLLVDVALEAGSMQLNLEEWQTVRKGDFLILDRCFFDPDEKKGQLILSLEGRPLFRAKIEKNGIKLLDYPLIERGEALMYRDEDDENEMELDEDEEDFYGDLGNEDEEEEFKNLLEKASHKKEKREEESGETVSTQMITSEETPSLSIEKLPLQLIVEVGRMRLTVQELMELSPGNFLKLPISAEQAVDLVVNSKKVGRGELVKMGDILGVRILEIGS